MEGIIVKKFRKMTSFILVLCLVLTFYTFPVDSLQATGHTEIPSKKFLERVDNFISVRKGEQFKILSYIPLMRDDESIISYCFFLEPIGYVIIDNNTEIVEASFMNTASYKALKSTNKNIYYAGPLNYYTKETSSYSDIVTKEKISIKDATNYIKDYADNVESAKQQVILENQTANARNITINMLSGTLRQYSYNTGNICGSTAAAIMLMYYRDYIDSYVVPSWHDTSTGESLIELIRPQINGDPPQGAFCSDVVRGLNYYFRWRGISNEYSSTWANGGMNEATYNTIRAQIIANNPVEVLINDHPEYDDHFVVVHGIEKDVYISTYYFMYVGDGWGSNDVIISLRYLREYAYIVS